MAVRVVRLGSARAAGEGVRIGTVRYPPRGVRKSELAARNLYDVWLPTLAPSAETIRAARGTEDAASWKRFVARYRREMSRPECKVLLDVLAALSRTADFSVGCYCADESRCHRSVLRALLREHGAEISEEIA